MDMIMSILEDVSRWETPLTEIIPVNYGEFFLLDKWLLVLRAIEKKLPQTQIVIPTNGSRFNPDMIRQLCEIKTIKIINFSVNAFFEDVYKEFMGLNPEVMMNIESSIKQIKVWRPDIYIWVSMVFDPVYHTDLERDKFKKKWEDLGCYPQIIPAASAGRDRPAQYNLTQPCRSLFYDFVIGYDGKLSSCCFDSGFILDLGFYSSDVKKDWANEKLTQLRLLHNNHERNTIPLCKGCTYA